MTSIVIMVIGTAIFFDFFRRSLWCFSVSNEEMLRLAYLHLEYAAFWFILAAFDVIAITFPILERYIKIICSFLRQLVLILPFAYVLQRCSTLRSGIFHSACGTGVHFLIYISMKKIWQENCKFIVSLGAFATGFSGGFFASSNRDLKQGKLYKYSGFLQIHSVKIRI